MEGHEYSLIQEALATILHKHRAYTVDDVTGIDLVLKSLSDTLDPSTDEYKDVVSAQAKLKNLSNSIHYHDAVILCDEIGHILKTGKVDSKFKDLFKLFNIEEILLNALLIVQSDPNLESQFRLLQNKYKESSLALSTKQETLQENQFLYLFCDKKSQEKLQISENSLEQIKKRKAQQLENFEIVIEPMELALITRENLIHQCQVDSASDLAPLPVSQESFQHINHPLTEINKHLQEAIAHGLELNGKKPTRFFQFGRSPHGAAVAAWTEIKSCLDDPNIHAQEQLERVLKLYPAERSEVTMSIKNELQTKFSVDGFTEFLSKHYDLRTLNAECIKKYTIFTNYESLSKNAENIIAFLETRLDKPLTTYSSAIDDTVARYNRNIEEYSQIRDEIIECNKVLEVLSRLEQDFADLSLTIESYNQILKTSTDIVSLENLQNQLNKLADSQITYSSDESLNEMISVKKKQNETAINKLNELKKIVNIHNALIEKTKELETIAKELNSATEIDEIRQKIDFPDKNSTYFLHLNEHLRQLFENQHSALVAKCLEIKLQEFRIADETLSAACSILERDVTCSLSYFDLYTQTQDIITAVEAAKKFLPTRGEKDFLYHYRHDIDDEIKRSRVRFLNKYKNAQIKLKKRIAEYSKILSLELISPLLETIEEEISKLAQLKNSSSLVRNTITTNLLNNLETKYRSWRSEILSISGSNPPKNIDELNSRVKTICSVQTDINNTFTTVLFKLSDENITLVRRSSEKIGDLWHTLKTFFYRLMRFSEIPDFRPRRIRVREMIENPNSLWSKRTRIANLQIEPAAHTLTRVVSI